MDLSSDAIKYASKSFTCCTFKKLLINPKDDNLEKNNDLICVFEFYPFTRTSSIDEHKKYMLHLLRSMSVNGKLVIYQRWDNPASLSVNYDVIKKEIKGYEFSDYMMPMRRIGLLFKNYHLSVLLSEVIRLILDFFSNNKVGYKKIVIVQSKK